MADLKIDSISFLSIQKVLTSSKLTNAQKAEFIKQHSSEIKKTLKTNITETEFAQIMKNRPLIRFRPFKNSFTKQGDKILLAKSVGIEPSEVDKYINGVIKNGFSNVSEDNIEKTKSYVYRHGTKNQVIAYVGHELSDTKNVLKKLYKTLEDDSGGLADYFSRPIHRMDNITLAKLYNAIDDSLKIACEEGHITQAESDLTAQWALVRIYQIQNNSKLIRAYDKYKTAVNNS